MAVSAISKNLETTPRARRRGNLTAGAFGSLLLSAAMIVAVVSGTGLGWGGGLGVDALRDSVLGVVVQAVLLTYGLGAQALGWLELGLRKGWAGLGTASLVILGAIAIPLLPVSFALGIRPLAAITEILPIVVLPLAALSGSLTLFVATSGRLALVGWAVLLAAALCGGWTTVSYWVDAGHGVVQVSVQYLALISYIVGHAASGFVFWRSRPPKAEA